MKTKTPSQSLKSVSSSTCNKYRKKKTLKRNPSFHDLTDEDRKYIWAAYKLGAFGDVEDQEKFDQKLSMYIAMNDSVYIFNAETNKGRIPVGMVTGKIMGPMMWLGDAIWFPWASSRNKYESMVNLFNEIRKTYVGIFTCTLEDKKFYENVARHGVIRRVGTLYDVTKDRLAFFQTRSP